MENGKFDAWKAGKAYDLYMGRWSRKVAQEFLRWLAPARDAKWLDVGCGTGGLTETVLAQCDPASVSALDPSDGFVAHARQHIIDERAAFIVGSAENLPFPADSMDVTTSGLVLNFVPDPVAALEEMKRVLRPGGLLSFYVWDYPGGGMGLIDAFWGAAAALDRAARDLDESSRFPTCSKPGLRAYCDQAGLNPKIVPVETVSEFPDFEAFWQPFTMGAGPAPGYCVSLPEDHRAALKAELKARLGDGPVSLPARAWAVKATMAP